MASPHVVDTLEPVAGSTIARPSARTLLTAVRPRQWPKNALVFAAPAAAGTLFQLEAAIEALLAFLAFTLAASGTYLVNDAIDAPIDRLHPVKSRRPVAAGLIGVPTAWKLGIFLMATSLGPAMLIGRPPFMLALVGYVALTLSYSMWLKRIEVVELMTVAMGFGIRAVAGALAVGVHASQWFLIVSFFGALFIVAGKRYGEHRRLGEQAREHRSSLAAYTISYHQHVMSLASGVTLVAYGLWAYQQVLPSQAWFLASFVFFAMVLLRYALLVHAGVSDDPVELMWKDVPLRALAVIWVVLVLLGIELR